LRMRAVLRNRFEPRCPACVRRTNRTRGISCPTGSGQRTQPDSPRMISQPLAFVSLAVLAVPLLAVAWLLLGPRLRGWVPIVALLGVIALIQIAGELGGTGS
jgi:hypothetical protein